ncbi:hypothetical protein WGM54_14290 [Paenibacillus polymyxa]|uniref:hypothetical protein n=1 Tax=Paenibacillus polymyxa TaxID=1406 RepID=UPI00307E28DF
MDEKTREALRKAVYLIGVGEGLKASELLIDLLSQPLSERLNNLNSKFYSE